MNVEYFPYKILEELKQKPSVSFEDLEKIASQYQLTLPVLLEITRGQSILLDPKSIQKKATRFRETGKYCLWRANNPLLTLEEARHLVEEIIQAFLGLFFAQRRYLHEAIETLSILLAHPNEAIQQEGIKGTFQLLVERLNDSFNPDYGPLYDHLFGEIVSFCRKQPAGQELDQQLKKFHIYSTSDLFFRKESLKNVSPLPLKDPLKKIILLSRVTIGADVAVTSILLKRLKKRYPQAQLVFMASSKAEEIFGGDPQIRVIELAYQRKGAIVERLSSWVDAVYLIENELNGLAPEEYLVIDPDSRITQLGLLPLLEEERRYLFFESRTFGGHSDLPLGVLVNNWFNLAFSEETEEYPALFLREEDLQLGEQIALQVFARGFKKIVSLNLGVGGNALKRIPNEFEFELLLALLQRGFFVFLDQGIGEELTRTSKILDLLTQQKFDSWRLEEAQKKTPISLPENVALLAWNGGIGGFAGLIRKSQMYVGYDSAGQHLAAALEVPIVDIFAGFTHPQMTKRWKPYGKAPVQMVVVDTIHSQTAIEVDAILRQTIACVETLFPQENFF